MAQKGLIRAMEPDNDSKEHMMKRNVLLSAGLAAAIGLSAFGIAQAAGNGNGGSGGSGGSDAPGGAAAQTQTQDRTRSEYSYRHEYRYNENEDSEHGDQLRTRAQTRTEQKSMDQVATELEAAGYKVRTMKAERYRYEAKVVDMSGTALELKLDPVTGDIVEQELD